MASLEFGVKVWPFSVLDHWGFNTWGGAVKHHTAPVSAEQPQPTLHLLVVPAQHLLCPNQHAIPAQPLQ